MKSRFVLLFFIFLFVHYIHTQNDSIRAKKNYRWSVQFGINFNYFDGFIFPPFRDKIIQNNYLTTLYYFGNYENNKSKFIFGSVPKGYNVILELPENKDIINNQDPFKNRGVHLISSHGFFIRKKMKYLLGIQFIKRSREISILVNYDPLYLTAPTYQSFRIYIYEGTSNSNYLFSKELFTDKLKTNFYSFEILNAMEFNFKKINLRIGINMELLQYSRLLIYQYLFHNVNQSPSVELRAKSFIFNNFNFNSLIHNKMNEFIQVEYLFSVKKIQLYPYFNAELYNHLRYAGTRTLFAWNYAFKFGIGVLF